MYLNKQFWVYMKKKVESNKNKNEIGIKFVKHIYYYDILLFLINY